MSKVIENTKKQRCCSNCGNPGHTKKKCTSEIKQKETKPKNKGTGAGGANTTLNGNIFEDKTNLSTEYASVNPDDPDEIVFKSDLTERHFIRKDKKKFYKYMKSINETGIDIEYISPGCCEPDEVYIDNENKICYIIEKKNQSGGGSVDEKLQTGEFKKYHFKQIIPNYTIHYIYCLSDWFKKTKYQCNLQYLEYKNIPYFWGDDANYKETIIQFICEQVNNF